MPSTIIKRNGTKVSFQPEFIQRAIGKALKSTGKEISLAESFTAEVLERIQSIEEQSREKELVLSVEMVQDLVEKVLMIREQDTAKAYILYRYQHELHRLKKRELLIEDQAENMDPNDLQSYFQGRVHSMVVYYKSYSRRIPHLKRREHWPETIDRFMQFLAFNDKGVFSDAEKERIHMAILHQRVMPSMRALQYAGAPANLSNIRIFNCSFTPITRPKDMADIMNILMQGAGAGFSVEEKFISKFPVPLPQTDIHHGTFVIPDSREGWVAAFRKGLDIWLAGEDITFDYSLIRPCGSPLVTSGGTASGPAPLRELLDTARDIIRKNAGRRMSDIDLYDIVCYIGKTVVAGNTRRSAEIALFDFNSQAMLTAKNPENYNGNGQRSQANNSFVLDKIPKEVDFLKVYNNLVQSNMGEPGIFNRAAVIQNMPRRRFELLGNRVHDMGTNPCGEIELQPYQFCNLTTIACRANSTLEELLEAQEISAMIGTFQATCTNFPGISKRYTRNTEEERLLGCSMTGMFDCPVVQNARNLELLKEKAVETNRIYAERFGISPATAVTCVKPEGTTSETLGTSSGIHPRFGKYYIRRYRLSADDAVYKVLRDQGVNMSFIASSGEYIVEFPVRAPEDSICARDVSAVEMFDFWLLVKKHYTEHNPSASIYAGEDEWISLLQRIWSNINVVSGMTMFPRDDHLYANAPFEEITKERYEEMVSQLPKIDFRKIEFYEREFDTTDVKREMACSGGACYL